MFLRYVSKKSDICPKIYFGVFVFGSGKKTVFMKVYFQNAYRDVKEALYFQKCLILFIHFAIQRQTYIQFNYLLN